MLPGLSVRAIDELEVLVCIERVGKINDWRRKDRENFAAERPDCEVWIARRSELMTVIPALPRLKIEVILSVLIGAGFRMFDRPFLAGCRSQHQYAVSSTVIDYIVDHRTFGDRVNNAVVSNVNTTVTAFALSFGYEIPVEVIPV